MIFVQFCVCWEFKRNFKFREKTLTKIKSPINRIITGTYWGGENFICERNCRRLSILEDITSPTFALSHHYNSGKIPLIHLDWYRLGNVSSAKEVFFSEEEEAIQRQAILVIEWPELIEPVINNFWKIEISYAKDYGRNYEIRDPKNLLTFS